MLVPKISQVVTFKLKDQPTQESVEYRTRVADEYGEILVIDCPINTYNGRMKRLKVGDVLVASFITNTGVKHTFETYVMKERDGLEAAFPLYEIARPAENAMTSIQRRNFFRISIEVDVAVQRLNGKRNVFRTDDIGGGGVSFIVDRHHSFEAGEQLNCWIVLPRRNGSIDHSSFVAEVVREKELETGRKLIMVKFNEIIETERQRIMQFLFEKQIQYRDR